MNKINVKFNAKTILRLIAVLLVAIPIVYSIGRIHQDSAFGIVVFYIIMSVVAEGVLVVLPDNKFADYCEIIGAVAAAFALSFFIAGGLLDFSDWVAGVNFWGDSTQAPSIITYTIMLLSSTLISTVNSFIK